MLWIAAVIYGALSPLVGFLVGTAIRARDGERSSAPEASPESVTKSPVAVASTPVDVRAIRQFTGRTPRSLRPAWQQRALRALGL